MRRVSLPAEKRWWLSLGLLVVGLLGVRMGWAGAGMAQGPPFELDARPVHVQIGSAIGPPLELGFR